MAGTLSLRGGAYCEVLCNYNVSLVKARDDAHPVADLLSALHSLWHCHYSGLQVKRN